MRGIIAPSDVVARKLAALDRLEPAFETSFQYVQDVQGLKRFATFPIANTVQYLGALVVCDAKDRLLSVPHTVDRYEGRYCLELLQRWQTGEVAGIVAFLQRKLDALPFTGVTREVEAVRRDADASVMVAALEHGRIVLLNRGFNLLQALEPLFTQSPQELTEQVRAACAREGYAPDQIAERLRERESPLYAPLRHPALAQRNMLLMDRVGVQAIPPHHTLPEALDWQATAHPQVTPPYAEQRIHGYVALTTPQHNNLAGVRFIDRPTSWGSSQSARV